MARTKTTTNGVNGATAPIFPAIRFDEGEFAQLRARLDLFDDVVVRTRYDVAGQEADTCLLDPLTVAMALSGARVSTGLLPRNCLFAQQRDGHKRTGILIEPQVW